MKRDEKPTEEKPIELFAQTEADIIIRCDNNATFSIHDLAQRLKSLNLPLATTVISENQLTLTFTWVMPPSEEVRHAAIKQIVDYFKPPKDVTVYLTFQG
jgi:hypothetical protein